MRFSTARWLGRWVGSRHMAHLQASRSSAVDHITSGGRRALREPEAGDDGGRPRTPRRSTLLSGGLRGVRTVVALPLKELLPRSVIGHEGPAFSKVVDAPQMKSREAFSPSAMASKRSMNVRYMSSWASATRTPNHARCRVARVQPRPVPPRRRPSAPRPAEDACREGNHRHSDPSRSLMVTVLKPLTRQRAPAELHAQRGLDERSPVHGHRTIPTRNFLPVDTIRNKVFDVWRRRLGNILQEGQPSVVGGLQKSRQVRTPGPTNGSRMPFHLGEVKTPAAAYRDTPPTNRVSHQPPWPQEPPRAPSRRNRRRAPRYAPVPAHPDACHFELPTRDWPSPGQ
ncbi:hypothetical protein SRIMM317S_00354 [Streptomyces rimosus subsp. rimosus]